MNESLGDSSRFRNEQGSSGDYWEGYQHAREHVWGPLGDTNRTSRDSMSINYSQGEVDPFPPRLRYMDDAPIAGATIMAGEVVRGV
jgi:hypothetical protein